MENGTDVFVNIRLRKSVGVGSKPQVSPTLLIWAAKDFRMPPRQNTPLRMRTDAHCVLGLPAACLCLGMLALERQMSHCDASYND